MANIKFKNGHCNHINLCPHKILYIARALLFNKVSAEHCFIPHKILPLVSVMSSLLDPDYR